MKKSSNENICIGDCFECKVQTEKSARLYCAVFQSVAQNALTLKKIKNMEAKFEKLTNEMLKVYEAVSPHVENINNPELTAFCKMVENTIEGENSNVENQQKSESDE